MNRYESSSSRRVRDVLAIDYLVGVVHYKQVRLISRERQGLLLVQLLLLCLYMIFGFLE